MSIPIISELTPKGGGSFPLMDDAYLRGGFHVVDNLTSRNLIPALRRKVGMRVAVQSTDIVYKLLDDLITWQVDREYTINLQTCYDQGAEIVTTSGKPVTLTGSDILSTIFEIKAPGGSILSVDGNKIINFTERLRGKEYTSSINAAIQANSQDITLDLTDKDTYRAVQYFYTVSNSDDSGFETGQLHLVHNGYLSSIYAIIGNAIGVPCGISFDGQLSGHNIVLKATTDNSGSFSRIVNLFKIALT